MPENIVSDPDPDLEPAIRRIGRLLADRSAGQAPSIFRPRWWSASLLDLCLKDEAFKVQLFRFVDALPSLGNDAQVTTLLNEYFGDVALPASFQWGMRMASVSSLGASLSAKAIRHQVEQM